MKRKAGFSLVEMMIVVAIMVVLMVGLYTVLNTGNALWQESENEVAIQRDARNVLWNIAKDMRMASGADIEQAAGTSSLTFSHPTEGEIVYTWSDSGGNANRILRQSPSKTRIVANNISALTFTDQGSSSLLVNVTVSRSLKPGTVSSFNASQEVTYR